MANILKKIFTPSVDQVSQTYTIQSWHVSQSVDALTAAVAYDISISGSLNVTGSSNVTGSLTVTGSLANGNVGNSATGLFSHAEGAILMLKERELKQKKLVHMLKDLEQ